MPVPRPGGAPHFVCDALPRGIQSQNPNHKKKPTTTMTTMTQLVSLSVLVLLAMVGPTMAGLPFLNRFGKKKYTPLLYFRAPSTLGENCKCEVSTCVCGCVCVCVRVRGWVGGWVSNRFSLFCSALCFHSPLLALTLSISLSVSLSTHTHMSLHFTSFCI